MTYRKSGIRGLGLGTQDKYAGPGTLHLGLFTWDPLSATHRQDTGTGIFMWDLRPRTLHLGQFTWELGTETVYGTGTQYLYVEHGTHTLIQT